MKQKDCSRWLRRNVPEPLLSLGDTGKSKSDFNESPVPRLTNILSQGTAVMHNAVSTLPANIKSKVVGGVLFGDTRNKQDRGQVPNYPRNNVIIFCVKDDGVCGGKLNVNAGHFAYTRNGDGPKAINFLKSKIDAAMGGRGRSVAEEMALLETRAAKGKCAKDPLPNGGESALITV